MQQEIDGLNYWESTDPVFILEVGGEQKTLNESEATILFGALGAFLKQPTATLGVDEYTVLEQWNDLKNRGLVKGSMDLQQARETFWAAMDGYFVETSKEVEHIDTYLIDLAERHQGTPS